MVKSDIEMLKMRAENTDATVKAMHTDVAAVHAEVTASRVELKSDMKTLFEATNKRIDDLFMTRADPPKDGGSAPAAPKPAGGPAQPTEAVPKRPTS